AASVTPAVHFAHWTAAFSQAGGGAVGSGTTPIVWPAQPVSPAVRCQQGPTPPESLHAATGFSMTLPLLSGDELITTQSSVVVFGFFATCPSMHGLRMRSAILSAMGSSGSVKSPPHR